MKTIWKFELSGMRVSIPMPEGAQLLHVAVQDDILRLWALVDPTVAPVERTFRVIGTGWSIDDAYAEKLRHVGTTLTEGGEYVWHVFEET